jgi:hypothetical protein
MNQIHSFCINEYKEKKYVKLDKRKNDCQLYCSEHQKKYYIDILNDEKDYILGNCHKYIDFFIDNDKNIFNGEIKFNNNSIIEHDDIFIAVCCTYKLSYITVDMYMFNKLPHIMENNDLFFKNCSIIKSIKKKFNITSYQLEEIFKKNLKYILYNLFDMTFLEMLK